jgi:hypothetical protein
VLAVDGLMTIETLKRTRATPETVRDRKAVRLALAPLSEQIFQWQAKAALLEARSEKRPGAAIDPELATLSQQVTSLTAKTREAVEKLPPTLRQHGGVIDVLRALDNLSERLSRCI